jgi:large subunit ribosomal protein L29
MSKSSATIDRLRDLPNEELTQTLATARDELFRLRLGTHTNQVASTAAVATKRREVAQIKTILRGREIGVEAQGQQRKGQSATARKES